MGGNNKSKFGNLYYFWLLNPIKTDREGVRGLDYMHWPKCSMNKLSMKHKMSY